jgi:hypothetical protein
MRNHIVFYDQARGRMPFLVETLHASSVESDYNQLEETLDFKIHASISKGNLIKGKSISLYYHVVLSKRVKIILLMLFQIRS